MSVPAKQSSSKRRLLLASDRSDRSQRIGQYLQTAGEVDTVSTSDIPTIPPAISQASWSISFAIA